MLPIGEDAKKPAAAMFYVAYTVAGKKLDERPITFLFNGGPGASSAFLHLGGVGPYRLRVNADGTLPPPPVRLADNALTWLTFTDLVFVDPVGTGYSHVLQSQPAKNEKDADKANDRLDRFWGVKQDLTSLGRFIRLYLTRASRWVSPKVLAGESYGGLRVAALAQRLPADFDIPLNGAILISPALEYAILQGGRDYNLLPWVVTLPSFAATAAYHHRISLAATGDDLATALAPVATFALSDMLLGLARADTFPAAKREAFYATIARFTGLPQTLVTQQRGRISPNMFAKQLLRDQALLVGRYDGTITGHDPYPEAPAFVGGDPSFDFLTTAYAPALLTYLREDLQYHRDAAYHVLNPEISSKWDFASVLPGKQGFIGVSDALEFGLTLNPDLQVLITHGYHDLVTPFLASRYLVEQMALAPDIRTRLRLKNYEGGHMFYLRQSSLQALHADVAAFYHRLTP
jgi:carboxypeptidase C (cathepsin A)